MITSLELINMLTATQMESYITCMWDNYIAGAEVLTQLECVSKALLVT